MPCASIINARQAHSHATREKRARKCAQHVLLACVVAHRSSGVCLPEHARGRAISPQLIATAWWAVPSDFRRRSRGAPAQPADGVVVAAGCGNRFVLCMRGWACPRGRPPPRHAPRAAARVLCAAPRMGGRSPQIYPLPGCYRAGATPRTPAGPARPRRAGKGAAAVSDAPRPRSALRQAQALKPTRDTRPKPSHVCAAPNQCRVSRA